MKLSTKAVDAARFLLGHAFGLIEIILVLRILLKFFFANPQTIVVNLIYRITGPLVHPFESIFPNLNIGNHSVETMTIVAILSYGLAIYVIFELLDHIHKSHLY